MNLIKDAIRALKREYGFPVILYNIINETLDLDSGAKWQVIQIKQIKQAILLPVKQHYKGKLTYNLSDRDLYVEYCDFEIKVGTKVIYQKKQYDVVKVNTYKRNIAYILKIRMSKIRAPILTWEAFTDSEWDTFDSFAWCYFL